MVKVKRIVHLEDKNKTDEKQPTSIDDESIVDKSIKEDHSEEEKRPSRKVRKPRHKFDEDSNQSFSEDVSDIDDISRFETPSKGIKGPRSLATPSSSRKRAGMESSKESLDNPLGKRQRVVRAATTPKKKQSTSLTPVTSTVTSDVEMEAEKEVEKPEATLEAPPEPQPELPKVTVTFKDGSSNPTGLQRLMEFMIRVLKRKDINGFFYHPLNETLCPGYNNVVENPIDFDIIQQKFDKGLYENIAKFRVDLMLLFDNPMLYFHKETVIYHTARKLRHFVRKTLAKEGLLGFKFNFPTFLANISILELGLSEADLVENNNAARDEEGNLTVELPQPAEPDQDVKMECSKLEKESSKPRHLKLPELKRQRAMVDCASQPEILTPWISAVGNAGITRNSTAICKRKSVVSTRQEDLNAMTTLAILNPDNAGIHTDANGEAAYRGSDTEVAVSLKQMLGRVTTGSGAIATFREDRRNIVKPIKYIDTTAYCSYGPSYDSRFANISKTDSDDLIAAFHSGADFKHLDEINAALAQSDSHELTMVDNLLDALTGGEHSKQEDVIKDRKQLAEETEQKAASEHKEDGDADSLSELDKLLDASATHILDLKKTQMERLSSTPPLHLALVKDPSDSELGKAAQVTSGLSSLVKRVKPQDLFASQQLFKALGIDLSKMDPEKEASPLGKKSSETTTKNALDAPKNLFQRPFGAITVTAS